MINTPIQMEVLSLLGRVVNQHVLWICNSSYNFQVINTGIWPGEVSNIKELKLHFSRTSENTLIAASFLVGSFRKTDVALYINICKRHLHEKFQLFPFFKLYLVILSCIQTKQATIGRYLKLAPFGGPWDSLATWHLLTRYVSWFKETGWVIM